MLPPQILTPADFALLNDLRIKAATKAVENGGGTAVKRKLAALEAEKRSHNQTVTPEDAFLTEGEILGPRKKSKMDYEERMASIQKGREGREKFGSKKGKKDKEAPSSSTNREKARNKPIMMAVHSNKVMQKKKASLRDVQVSFEDRVMAYRSEKEGANQTIHTCRSNCGRQRTSRRRGRDSGLSWRDWLFGFALCS